MKAAIHSPYFDTLGGGERYVLSIAKVLKDAGYDVYVETKDASMLEKAQKRLGLDLTGINTTGDVKRGNGYDLCFWLSDGSVPTLFARRNFLHFQRPFWGVDGKSLITRMKFFRIEKVIVNSLFTKKWIDREYPCESIVIYPPVDISKFKSGKKENIILYVGRFSELEQSKRQDVLLRAFKRLYDQGCRDWKLVLAGGSDIGRTDFVDKLIKDAKGYPIEIKENISFKEVRDLYSKAKIFWSAAGYGVKEEKEPNKVEHFGITVVEAMASRAIPVAFNAGGHTEIVKNKRNGFLWERAEQLISITKKLIENPKEVKRIFLEAKKSSEKYSYARFEKEFLALL